MNGYDELKQLQEQIAHGRHLESKITELRRQITDLSASVRELERIKRREEADVERLESGKLSAVFYRIIGRNLDREQVEAYAARVKYETAVRELTAAEEELRRCEGERENLKDSEERYAAALREKEAAIKAAGGANAEEILKLEGRIANLESQRKELREAVHAGNAALQTAKEIRRNLDSAEGWGTWDLVGGGLIADLAKHSKLDEAQELVQVLQVKLRNFKAEFADVSIQADMQVNVDGFLRFADYFFDGLIADWAVLDHISEAQEQVEKTTTRIQSVVWKLETMETAAKQEQKQLQLRLDELIVEANL